MKFTKPHTNNVAGLMSEKRGQARLPHLELNKVEW